MRAASRFLGLNRTSVGLKLERRQQLIPYRPQRLNRTSVGLKPNLPCTISWLEASASIEPAWD